MDRVRSSKILLVLFFVAGLITTAIDQNFFLHFIENLPNVCPLRRFTGLQCAFCGMTHAWIYFWHGDFLHAFQENRLSILLFIGAPLFLLSLIFSRFWTYSRTKVCAWVSLAVLVSYTILRNLNL